MSQDPPPATSHTNEAIRILNSRAATESSAIPVTAANYEAAQADLSLGLKRGSYAASQPEISDPHLDSFDGGM